MICTLRVVRYPKWMGWAGFLSMAVFRLPLWLKKDNRFWKLMGCGRNGTFSIIPDWRQWALLEVGEQQPKTSSFILNWWKFFSCEKWTVTLEPLEGFGKWDGQECFGKLPGQSDHEGMIAILTRATIRIKRLRNFWKHVDSVSAAMNTSEGLITSIGIGEMPWIRQATFSIWENREKTQQFAYRMREHTEVIRKTRAENWYSEEMFVRFRIISSEGSLKQLTISS